MDLHAANNKRLKLIKDLIKRAVSRASDGKESVILPGLDLEKIEFLISKTIDTVLPGAEFLHNQNKAIDFAHASMLAMINDSTVKKEDEETTPRQDDIDAQGIPLGDKYAKLAVTTKETLAPKLFKLSEELQELIDNSLVNDVSLAKVTLIENNSLFVNLEEAGGLDLVGSGNMPTGLITLPIPDVETIKSMFLTNSDDVNYYLESILEEYSSEDLIKVWEKYIYNFYDGNEILETLMINPLIHSTDLMLVYGAIRNMYEKGHPLIDNNEGFKERMFDMLEVVKKTITRYNNSYRSNKMQRNLVVFNREKEIFVLAPHYEEFIENSTNGIDTLMGFNKYGLKSNIRSITVEEIMNNEDFYYTEYKHYINIEKLSQSKINENNILSTYKLNFGKFMDVINSLPIVQNPGEEVLKPAYVVFLENYYKSENISSAENFVFNYFKTLIPLLGRFLDGGEKIVKTSGENYSPKEIALYNIVTLITEEVMSGVIVTEMGKFQA